MGIQDRYIDIAGKYRVTVAADDIHIIRLKFHTVVDDSVILEEAQKVYNFLIEQEQISSWQSIDFSL